MTDQNLSYGLADLLQVGFHYDKATGQIDPTSADLPKVTVGDTPIEFKLRLIGGLIQNGVATAVCTGPSALGLIIRMGKDTTELGICDKKQARDETRIVLNTTEFRYTAHVEIERMFKDCQVVYQLAGRKKTAKWKLLRDKTLDSGSPEVDCKGTEPAVSG